MPRLVPVSHPSSSCLSTSAIARSSFRRTLLRSAASLATAPHSQPSPLCLVSVSRWYRSSPTHSAVVGLRQGKECDRARPTDLTQFRTSAVRHNNKCRCRHHVHHRQSLTKFYDGHNVTVGGAIASATKEINDKIHFYSNIHGNILRCDEARRERWSVAVVGWVDGWAC